MDGRGLSTPRVDGRLHSPRSRAERAPRAIQLRHHLWHQRRVRVRLPARQRHGHAPGGPGPAGHYFAIVDEVDSILIDEARVPLIISGPAVIAADSNEYDKYKPVVESLVHAQEKLCARFLSEAEELLKRLRPADGSNAPEPDLLEREIGLLLYKVKMGQPRSEGLLKLLEEPENLRLMNKAELELHVDQSKKEIYAQKEELFLTMDEKSNEADSTEK